jgi:hypothetical protein
MTTQHTGGDARGPAQPARAVTMKRPPQPPMVSAAPTPGKSWQLLTLCTGCGRLRCQGDTPVFGQLHRCEEEYTAAYREGVAQEAYRERAIPEEER